MSDRPELDALTKWNLDTSGRSEGSSNGQDHDHVEPESVDDHGAPDPPEFHPEAEDQRHIMYTAASKIVPRRVQWLWDARIALGTLALLAGREGLGKSIVSYTIAAMITRGMLPGEFYGEPKSVLVAAAEDSWSQTIVPRLIAADADLDRVCRRPSTTPSTASSACRETWHGLRL